MLALAGESTDKDYEFTFVVLKESDKIIYGILKPQEGGVSYIYLIFVDINQTTPIRRPTIVPVLSW